jgi:hypothetical protein
MSISKENFMPRWYDELWNKSNNNIIDEMRHENCKSYGLSNETVIGNEQFKSFCNSFRNALDNVKVTVEKNFVNGDYLTSLCTVRAIDKATGKPIEFLGTSIGRLEGDKIVESWNCFNFLDMYVQSGKIKADQLL